MLERWHEKNASDATYGEIINAMMKEQKRDEAEKVCELLNSKSHQLCTASNLLHCKHGTFPSVQVNPTLGPQTTWGCFKLIIVF